MKHDVFVVGAGPAGSALSCFLAREGVRVLCVDKARFPRRKVCGEFLSPETRRTLAALGLEEELKKAAPITGFRFVAESGRRWEGDFASLPKGERTAFGLGRSTLDVLLASKAREAGAEVEEGFTVTGFQGAPGAWTVSGRRGGSPRTVRMEADWLVGADGQHSLIHRKLLGAHPFRERRQTDLFGFQAHFRNLRLHGCVELDFFRGGYVGSNPVESGEANVCFLIRRRGRGSLRHSEQDLDAFLSRLCRRQPSLAERLSGGVRSTPWSRTGRLRFGTRRCFVGGALLIGDSAGAIDPFAGDGISMALRGAEILASLLAAGGEDLGSRLYRAYSAAWAAAFGRRMRWAAGLRPLLNFTALPDALFQALSKRPSLSRRIVAATRTPASSARPLPQRLISP
ncbi:MAG: NAD(P)/FAD-dependent oxidoreductase [Nitrospinota bacterium]